jgi:uncharacterized protein
MTRSQPPTGQFVWYNLLTGNPGRAAGFYGRLFGWTTRDLHVGAAHAPTTFRSGEHDVGGLVKASSGRSQWLPLIGFEDVDAALSEASRLGGSVTRGQVTTPATATVPTVLDPTGAPFCPVAAASAPGQLADAAMPGHFCWSELTTSEPLRAAAFYAALTGWTISEWNLADQEQYWLFRRGDRDVAGMVRLSGGAGSPSGWLPYVQVVSAEETAALAVDLGGSIVTPPGDVPGRGRSAVIEDPGGARLAVFALTDAA